MREPEHTGLGYIIEQHNSTRPSSALHIVAEADTLLILHDDGTVTCAKDRDVTYKRRGRNQLPERHRFAIEDHEATNA